ncbi:hypothetical protein UNPA324_12130 [Bradyrhizobium sp. UNPA324]|nr:hypothetical protein UNPA324_12130 [Bradyrhizobium sp. UNPA324]
MCEVMETAGNADFPSFRDDTRAPDAAQRLFDGAPQSRGPYRQKALCEYGSGAAAQRYAPHRVRDARVSCGRLAEDQSGKDWPA